MASRIEDYALLGDTQSAALVSRDGSIDWLAFPRFDSPACFAALLGHRDNGRWKLAPESEVRRVERRYRPGTLVLETDFHTDEGVVRVVDCLTPRDQQPNVVRLVEGLEGRVAMAMDLRLRFDYGSIVPWVRRIDGLLTAVAGPEAVCLATPVETKGEDLATVAHFSLGAGESVPFVLEWYPSHTRPLPMPDPHDAVAATQDWWERWSGRCRRDVDWADELRTSLVVLKALTHAPTGGLVAAPTTSLPEDLGGVRNWDYRYCWLRDATFSLLALLSAGYTEEAVAWREWLLRAAAGEPSKLQIMYGPAGERRLPEWTVPWLSGYEGSAPVRIGNAASDQFQLDVYGEVMDALHQGRRAGVAASDDSWALQKALLDFLEGHWRDPDDGIWEVRGGRRHFTHSKVMAWVALDRAVKAVEDFGLDGPVDRWRAERDEIHAEVCREGVDERGAFVQYFGGRELDASLLMVPLVGFLPAHDQRVRATVEAIERELMVDGFVLRYRARPELDGLPGDEGAFLLCSFWLADNYALQGRFEEGRDLFERLLSLANDVGLLAEEYDPHARRLVGNFPQAFSHVALANTAIALCRPGEGASQRP